MGRPKSMTDSVDAKKVRELMFARKIWGHAELSEISGVSVRSITKLMNGEGISLKLLDKIAASLDVEFSDLFTNKPGEDAIDPEAPQPEGRQADRTSGGTTGVPDMRYEWDGRDHDRSAELQMLFCNCLVKRLYEGEVIDPQKLRESVQRGEYGPPLTLDMLNSNTLSLKDWIKAFMFQLRQTIGLYFVRKKDNGFIIFAAQKDLHDLTIEYYITRGEQPSYGVPVVKGEGLPDAQTKQRLRECYFWEI
jgi:DNA-binding Xre family transcriptional regulator